MSLSRFLSPFVVLATLTSACGGNGSDTTTSESSGGGGGGASTSHASSGAGAASSGNAGGDGAAAGTGGGSASGGGGSAAGESPTVRRTYPADGDDGVDVNPLVSAVFSEPMDCSTVTEGSFTVTQGASVTPLSGAVTCFGSTAVFGPNVALSTDQDYTATLTTAVESLGGSKLAAKYVWHFRVADLGPPDPSVDLGTAGDYVVLAKTKISTVPASAITGNLGMSPSAASFITGFSLVADPSNVFSKSAQVNGNVYAANYATPTHSNLIVAVVDMETAFTDAAGRAAGFTEIGAGNIGGMTLVHGVYKWGTGVTIPTDLTLSGDANDVWIFQIAQDLVMSSGTQVRLAGGALSKNVFWQVAGLVDIGTTAHLEGVVLTQTAAKMHTGASLDGRLLAQTAVTLDTNKIVEPLP